MSAHSLTPGARIGPYEIQHLLGAGGMGEVYKARDTRLGRTVAIKVLPPAPASNPHALQRFEREARAVSTLNHPHICTLHDIGQHDGVVFLVMEFLDGETLAQRLAKGPLSIEEALRYAREIADALDEAHGHDIIHRDLKPSNVVLTKTGAKLLDFGIAKLYEDPAAATVAATRTSLTHAGDIEGTPQYMAPEQIEGQPVDARTDIFAFGALIYEMIAGRKAFDAPSRAGLIAMIANAGPPSLADAGVAASPELEQIIRRCLEKRPQDRFPSAHDLALSLEALSTRAQQRPRFPRHVTARRRGL